jgi:hypothetical protein
MHKTFQHCICADPEHCRERVPGYICKACVACQGTGLEDSGGVTPWGAGIDVPCSMCCDPDQREGCDDYESKDTDS